MDNWDAQNADWFDPFFTTRLIPRKKLLDTTFQLAHNPLSPACKAGALENPPEIPANTLNSRKHQNGNITPV